jgi:hypothetical protein
MRPRTAATTNKYDESRIKDKLRALERLEDSLTNDIDKVANEIDLFTMVREAESYAENPGRENGVRLTKQLVLDNSMVEELIEVKTLLLREKKITVFDDNSKDGLYLNDLSNIECLMASHNFIKDVSGVC